MTDPLTGCVYEAEVDVICDGDGGGDGGRLKREDQFSSESHENTIFLSDLFVYPVPASERLIVRGKSLIGSKLILVNSDGKKVFAKDDLSSERQIIDVNGLAEGIYYVIVEGPNGSIEKAIPAVISR